MANTLLRCLLQVVLVLEFDILNNSNLIREPFVARIDFAMEPVELEDLHSLIESKDDPKATQGMFQLTNLMSARSGGIIPPLTPMRRNIWDVARQKVDAAGHADYPIGLVEFVNNSIQSTTVSVYISTDALNMVRVNPPVQIPTGGDSYILKPMSAYTCMECVSLIFIYPGDLLIFFPATIEL
jgi:hypothetical protein